MQSAAEARSYFEDTPEVTVVEVPINDGWARDWGPSVSITRLLLCFVFLNEMTVSSSTDFFGRLDADAIDLVK